MTDNADRHKVVSWYCQTLVVTDDCLCPRNWTWPLSHWLPLTPPLLSALPEPNDSPVLCTMHPFDGPVSRTAGWAGIRKVKPVWILLKQETVSGGGISWAICKSAPCSKQITTPASHHSVFYRPDALPAAQPTASKHWRIKHRILQCFSAQGYV